MGELRRFFCDFASVAADRNLTIFSAKNIFILARQVSRQIFFIKDQKLKILADSSFFIGRAFCNILKIFRFFNTNKKHVRKPHMKLKKQSRFF